ncbi:MAG: purine-nucleoside phosphorylase [Lachnospiraceae bacterium]|nr:purine-nucleoside phosphorylase [Lachnospiraceae bacterium]
MSNYPTPHIDAKPGDFGRTVLMPGDPLRAKFIAEQYLEAPVLVNNVRGIQGYTGTYEGTKVSVMASGMGMPSIGIYSYELYHFFNVEHIIRIGSAGAYQKDVRVRDLVLGQGACYDSNYAAQFHLPGTFSAIASYSLLSVCAGLAEEMGLRFHVGNLVSSDRFYGDPEGVPEGFREVPAWSKMGVLAVEMEAAALYMNAARAGKHALAVCTVSDHLLTGESTSAAERQESFTDMMKLALRTAVCLEKG